MQPEDVKIRQEIWGSIKDTSIYGSGSLRAEGGDLEWRAIYEDGSVRRTPKFNAFYHMNLNSKINFSMKFSYDELYPFPFVTVYLFYDNGESLFLPYAHCIAELIFLVFSWKLAEYNELHRLLQAH